MRVRGVVAVLISVLLMGVVPFLPTALAGPFDVTIETPDDGDALVGTVTLSGTAHSDNGITHVLFRVDDGAWQQVGSKSGQFDVTWSHTFDTTSYPNGAHVLRVAARDAGGMSVEDTLSVTFDNPVLVDLAVVAVDGTAGVARAPIEVQVANAGSDDVFGAVGSIAYRYREVWHEIGTFTVDVPAGGQTMVLFQWDSIHHIGSFPVRVTLDPADVLAEADESNNVGEGTASFYVSGAGGLWLLWPVSPDPQHWQTKQVRILGQEVGYAPAVMVTRVTDYLIFWNEDDELHTVTADDGSFDSDWIEPGWYDILTFDAPGTYTYHCDLHPGMAGTIVVLG